MLIKRPELRNSLATQDLAALPKEYQQLVSDLLRQADSHLVINQLLEAINKPAGDQDLLPRPRETDLVYKYEEGNPYKEIGLSTHFERLGRFVFITRLQSYRYLTRNKASQDRIQYVSPDCLGGIFTNKEKSIYYYIFLTEPDQLKAQNAARLLNLTLYDKGGGF